MESSLEERRETLWKEGSLILSLGGWAVFLSAITTFLFAIFPVKLVIPEWQLITISALYNSSASILIGSLLICTARLFNPTDSQLKKNGSFIRWLAGLLAVILLATIPMSLYAGYRAIKSNEAQSKVALKEWKKQLATAQSFASEAEMRSWAASQPEPIDLPPTFDSPFPVIKQRLTDNITGRINLIKNQIDENYRSQWLGLLVDFSRNSIQALLLMTAFSSLSTGGFIRNILLDIARNRFGLGTSERNRGAI